MLYSRTIRTTDVAPFETCFVREEHGADDVPARWHLSYTKAAIGVVLSGCFDYRAPNGAANAIPGTVIFGNPGESFTVRHDGPVRNHRLVVWYERGFLEEIAADHGAGSTHFRAAALPPGKTATALFAHMKALDFGGKDEFACALAATAFGVPCQVDTALSVSARDRGRILEAVRHIQTCYAGPCTVEALATAGGFSRYRFMRLFKAVTGETVAQYVMSVRLRAAVARLGASSAPVSEIAFDTGFNDLSHFNAAFRAAFSCSPRQMRVKLARR